MKELIKKFQQFILGLAEGKINNELIKTPEECCVLDNLIKELIYLLCHKKCKNFTNKAIADDIIKEGKILRTIYHSQDSLLEKVYENIPESKDALDRDGYFYEEEERRFNERYIGYKNFWEKQGEFIYKYEQINPFYNGTFRQSLWAPNKYDRFSISIPIIITGDKREEYIKLCNNSKIDENIYKIPAELVNKAGHKIKNLKNYNLVLRSNRIRYQDIDNALVLREWIVNGEYQILKDFQRYQSKFLIIDKEGNVINNNKIDTLDTINDIRQQVAHKGMSGYRIKCRLKGGYSGEVIFLKNKTAVIIPQTLFGCLAHYNVLNYRSESKESVFIYTPQLEKPIQSAEECEQYLSKCKKVEIVQEDKDNMLESVILIDSLLERKEYDINNINKDIQKIFPKVLVGVSKIENAELITKKLTKDGSFFNEKDQQGDIKFLIQEFYGNKIISKDVVKGNGKYDYVNISPVGVEKVLLENAMRMITSNEDGRLKPEYDLKFYEDEWYISLCIFLIYTNLIYNGFKEDVDPKKSQLSDEEIRRIDNKMINLDMNKFNMCEEGKRPRKPQGVPDKKIVIATVRNCIAHNSIKVKFSKNGNPKDMILRFGYLETDKMWNEISCEHFLEFINNDLFVNYTDNDYNIIQAESFQDLIEKVKQKM